MYTAQHNKISGKFQGVIRNSDGAMITKAVGNKQWKRFEDWDASQPTQMNRSDIAAYSHTDTANETEIKRVDDLTKPTDADLNSVLEIMIKERRNRIPT